MNSNVIVTRHAHERIAQRLEPILGSSARWILEERILEAAWRHSFRRRAPKWLAARAIARGEDVRYVTLRIDGLRIACVVAFDANRVPVLVTVMTDAPRKRMPLAPVPVLPDGRVIGRPSRRELPVAFAQVA